MKDIYYMQRQHIQNNEEFFDADGWGNDSEAFSDFSQTDLGADAVASTPAANAPKSAMGVDYSTPYIVQLAIGSANVTDVEVLNAAKRQASSTTTGVTYSYGSGAVTYDQFLAAINSGSGIFECGLTRIIASHATSSTAEAQVLTTITITSLSLDGTSFSKPIYPSISGVQYKQTQVDIPYTFMVDGLVSFKLGTCYANATIIIRFYPSKKSNPFKQIQQGVGTSQFKNPQVNKLA